jgi:hypothetical protein
VKLLFADGEDVLLRRCGGLRRFPDTETPAGVDAEDLLPKLEEEGDLARMLVPPRHLVHAPEHHDVKAHGDVGEVAQLG